jgi:hypothetical protein
MFENLQSMSSIGGRPERVQDSAVSVAQKRILELENELARSNDKTALALRDQQVSHLMQRLEEEKRRAGEVSIRQAMTGVLPFVERIMTGPLGNANIPVNSNQTLRPDHEAIERGRGHMRTWGPEQVGNFLKDRFVSNYEIFVQEGVCGRELALFTATDFMEPPFSLRKRQAEALLMAIGDAQRGLH